MYVAKSSQVVPQTYWYCILYHIHFSNATSFPDFRTSQPVYPCDFVVMYLSVNYLCRLSCRGLYNLLMFVCWLVCEQGTIVQKFKHRLCSNQTGPCSGQYKHNIHRYLTHYWFILTQREKNSIHHHIHSRLRILIRALHCLQQLGVHTICAG